VTLFGILSLLTIWGPNLLAVANIIERPRAMMCDCGFLRSLHLPSWGYFTVGAGYIAHAIIEIGTAEDLPSRALGIVFVVIGALYLIDWWKHSKNKRKRLLERALGVVRATAAGLKVVPVPAGAQA
jgi:hypothetical protein